MATKLYINYVRLSDLPGVSSGYTVKRIHLMQDKELVVRVADGNRYRYNFRNTPQTVGSIESPHGYQDTVYRYMVDADGVLHAWIACIVPGDTALPEPDYQVVSHNAAATIFLAQGETDSYGSTVDMTAYAWVPGALTTQQKKSRAIASIEAFREQKKRWLLEAPEYADLVPNIVTHLGYWLRSADYVIKLMFDQGEAGTLDWLIVESIAKEAIKGPRTLDPDGDGAYNVEFFQRLKAAATAYPTGPTFGALWVRTWDLTGVGDVDRVADFTADVINTHGNGGTNPLTDPPDRTYHNIPAAYNSTATYWSS